jgi:hypothetical protein
VGVDVSRSDASTGSVKLLAAVRRAKRSEQQECGLQNYNRSSCSASMLRTLMKDARRGSIR